MRSPHINYCLDCMECPSCGSGREVVPGSGLICSWCESAWTHRILCESPVEDGEIVEYRGELYHVDMGPQNIVFLIGLDDPHPDWRSGAPWAHATDIRDVDPVDVVLRYEVRHVDSDDTDMDQDDGGVFRGFDDYDEACNAARVWTQVVGQTYGVWGIVESRFVDELEDDVVRKDDPVVPCPFDPDAVTVRELHEEYRQRAAEAARMNWGDA